MSGIRLIEEGIEFNFYDVVNASKVLVNIIKGSHLFDIGMGSIRYVLTPQASRIIPHFRMILYPLPPYGTGRILTPEDFKKYDLIQVQEGWLRFFSRINEFESIELHVRECHTTMYVSNIKKERVYEAPQLYEELISKLPHELTTKYDPKNEYVSDRALFADYIATTTMTFLYNISKFADKLRFVKWPFEERYDPDADAYGKELIEEIRKFGDSFEEIFRTLVVVGAFF
jgi:hypothetical protein